MNKKLLNYYNVFKYEYHIYINQYIQSILLILFVIRLIQILIKLNSNIKKCVLYCFIIYTN